MAGTKRIGVMAASEPELQEALLRAWGETPGVVGEVVEVGAANEGMIARHDVIVDRVSPRVPCYRSYLRAATLAGANVVVDPFHPAADDAFFSLSAARRLGIPTARTVLLPQHDYPTVDDTRVLSHLEHPLRWDAVLAWVGAPAVLRPATPSPAWERQVVDLPALWQAFDETGAEVVMLQAAPPTSTRLRALCIGPWATVTVEGPPAKEAVMASVAALAQRLRRALGLPVSEAVFGLGHDGGPLLLDGARPYPDLGPDTLGNAWNGAVEALARVAVEAARDLKRVRDAYPFGGR